MQRLIQIQEHKCTKLIYTLHPYTPAKIMELDVRSAIVYLVDDDESVRDSLSVLIKSVGIEIQCFESAHVFLNHFRQELPGCLILDLNMPIMGGLELQAELCKRDIHIPIIFISGNAEVADSARAFRSGAVDFLLKPFDVPVLLARIREAIAMDIHNKKPGNQHKHDLQIKPGNGN